MPPQPQMTQEDAEKLNMVPKKYRDLGVNVGGGFNGTDFDGNPAGGRYSGMGMSVTWQDGPREMVPTVVDRAPDGTPTMEDKIEPANGAFVEDVIYAAIQRLQFYQRSQFAHEKNAEAIVHLEDALGCLNDRTKERKERGVEGTHTV